jgi:hypothetical protein
MVMSPAGLDPEKDCDGEVQQQLYITNPSSRQRGRPIKKPQMPYNFNGRERGNGSESQTVVSFQDRPAD